MPVLLTKIEGKGNGIKTVVPNMAEVARALARPPSYPTKFFGCELGAQTTFDDKNERYIVNGAHQADRLRELLDAFIDKFVLCGDCKNPETDLNIVKNKEARSEDIIRDCKACGAQTIVDMRHKLTPLIVKNPPKSSKKSKSGKKGSDGPANGGSNGTHAVAVDPAPVEEADSDGAPNGNSGKASPVVKEVTDVNTEFSIDTSEEAMKARLGGMNELSNKLQASLLADDDSDDDANSPYTQIGQWAEANRDNVNSVEVYKHAQDLGIEKKHRTVQALVQGLFTKEMPTEIAKFAPLFVKVCLLHHLRDLYMCSL